MTRLTHHPKEISMSNPDSPMFKRGFENRKAVPVSYTHLTLPTN